MNAISATDTAMPAGARERLGLFAEWTGTTPPARIISGEGEELTFSDELLTYAQEQGLSLDWLWFGNVRGLVMANHNRERRA